MKSHAFFTGADRNHLTPGFETQSNYLCHTILNSLPSSELDQFLNQPEFKTDGFKMFSHLIECLQPDANETKFSNILAPASRTFEPNNTIDLFMLRDQTCFNSLQGILIESLISLLVLCHIDKSQFPGIQKNLLAFEPALFQADLTKIANHLHCEKSLCDFLGADDATDPMNANRASNKLKQKDENSSNDHKPYPPSLPHPNEVMNFIDANPTRCIACFSSNPTHLKEGCPHCAKKGIVVQ